MEEATEGGWGVQGRAQELAELVATVSERVATVSVELGALLAVTINELRADLDALTADVRVLSDKQWTNKEG